MACLRWTLDNPGAHEVIEAYERFGQEIPEALIQPELRDIERDYWWAFWELSTERRASMGGATPIPASEIRRYGREEFPGDPCFCEIIRAMDEEYLTGKRAFSRDHVRRDV